MAVGSGTTKGYESRVGDPLSIVRLGYSLTNDTVVDVGLPACLKGLKWAKGFGAG